MGQFRNERPLLGVEAERNRVVSTRLQHVLGELRVPSVAESGHQDMLMMPTLTIVNLHNAHNKLTI